MHELGNVHGKAFKKSARVVGDCLGKYHPHGDMAVYDALVRMAQPFSLRYMLVDGQGNMGSVDGDSPAAMRYTEVRMARVTRNCSGTGEGDGRVRGQFRRHAQGAARAPFQGPNLLINGSSGIAVGMATNIPPHNLAEIVDGTIAMIDGAGEDEVLRKVSGPDFPTGGVIVGRAGIYQAYKTGRGIITVRGKVAKDEKKHTLLITEIPYQLTKTAS